MASWTCGINLSERCHDFSHRKRYDDLRRDLLDSFLVHLGINRLQACAMGEIELTMMQVRAIEIILKKCLPDLSKTEVKAEVNSRYVAQLPDVLSKEEWLAKYGKGQITLQ